MFMKFDSMKNATRFNQYQKCFYYFLGVLYNIYVMLLLSKSLVCLLTFTIPCLIYMANNCKFKLKH